MELRGGIVSDATERQGGRDQLGARSPQGSLIRASDQHHELLPPPGRARTGDLNLRTDAQPTVSTGQEAKVWK
jgi:hypothetical protein